MKRNYMYHYVGIVLLAFLAYGNVRYVYAYMSLSRIKTVFSYGTYIGYVVIPVAVITGLLAVYSVFVKSKSRLDWFYISSWAFLMLFTVVLYFYFESKSNDLEIVVKNLSAGEIKEINVATRNIHSFESRDLNRGDSLVFECKCREATGNDSIGVRLSYQGKLKPVKIRVVSSNEAVYRQKLYVLLVNDTLSFVNHDIEGQWIGLEKASGVYTTQQVYTLAGQ
ncbi:hypothetical protein KK062_11035 [Fulvivirgaceae bacterium PWU5]|uniref:Uncharacterized protein n=1 Tax=Dawidia cretensis TaxID=2782350 RepID=A0AAP2GTX0_9BACT|nr:hypothetical protein [Dawidia cretensis]MBT1708763.1 hypothetical protein [Dawidia cretensis]